MTTDKNHKGLESIVFPMKSFRIGYNDVFFISWYKYTLKTMIKNQGLASDEKRPLALRVIQALDVAHQQGIAHNNLTSSTILMDSSINACVSSWAHLCLSRNKNSILDHEKFLVKRKDLLLKNPYTPPEVCFFLQKNYWPCQNIDLKWCDAW